MCAVSRLTFLPHNVLQQMEKDNADTLGEIPRLLQHPFTTSPPLPHPRWQHPSDVDLLRPRDAVGVQHAAHGALHMYRWTLA